MLPCWYVMTWITNERPLSQMLNSILSLKLEQSRMESSLYIGQSSSIYGGKEIYDIPGKLGMSHQLPCSGSRNRNYQTYRTVQYITVSYIHTVTDHSLLLLFSPPQLHLFFSSSPFALFSSPPSLAVTTSRPVPVPVLSAACLPTLGISPSGDDASRLLTWLVSFIPRPSAVLAAGFC